MSHEEPTRLTLSPADAAAADHLLDGAPARDAAREKMVSALLQRLSAAPTPAPRGDLLARTLAAVQQDRMTLHTNVDTNMAPLVRRRWSRRMAEFASMAVAAGLLFAVVWVGVGQSQQSKGRVACAANMAKLATGFGEYGALHGGAGGGALPFVGVPSDGNWMHSKSGDGPRSNAENLLPLVEGKFVTLAMLNCPGKAPEAGGEIGYSYTYLNGTKRSAWDGNHNTIVLGDRNPMFVAGAKVSAVDKNSSNHGAQGNYLVRADGSVTWETSPNVGPGRDNIWTVTKGKERLVTYTGTEAPASAADVFLCP